MITDDEFEPLSDDADDESPHDDHVPARMAPGAASAGGAVAALVANAYRDATTRRQRRAIASTPAIAVVISVPSAAWVAPVAALLRREASWRKVVVGDGGTSRFPPENAEVAHLLSEGGRLVGVSHSPDRLLPRALLAAADHRISIPGVAERGLRRTISKIVGGRVPTLDPGIAAGVDLLDVASAIRVGTTPASCIARLKAAREVASGGNQDLAAVPLLDQLH